MYNDPTKPCVDKPPSPVDMAFDRLNKLQDEAHAAITQLEEATRDILMQETETSTLGGGSAPAPIRNTSRLEDRLETASESMQRLINRMRSIINRCTL